MRSDASRKDYSLKTFTPCHSFLTFESLLQLHPPPFSMKNILTTALFALLIVACQQTDKNASGFTDSKKNGLSLVTENNPEWQYENLRLYPIVADASVNSTAKSLKTLSEAMKTPGFRVLERKQFGRDNEHWYNGLTIQNKTTDTVFVMAGDVVTGGNQDRVMAYHEIVLPGTVKNIDVFCVEAGRSAYYDESASQAEKNVAAFKGYYNVASPQVRHAVQATGDQGKVWQAVANVTKANGAESSTKAYAALETASDQKAKRDAYLHFFEGKITNNSNVVGVVAVCGNNVLGIDVFSDANLFARQFPALLHGYVADAAVAEKSDPMSDATVYSAFESVANQASATAKPTETAGKYSINGNWIHLFRK